MGSLNDVQQNVVNGNLTAHCYVSEILPLVVIPFLARHSDVTLFHHDNARPHSARLTSDFLVDNNDTCNVLPWPAFAPDLSPIEHLWDQLGRLGLQQWLTYPEQMIDVLTGGTSHNIEYSVCYTVCTFDATYAWMQEAVRLNTRSVIVYFSQMNYNSTFYVCTEIYHFINSEMSMSMPSPRMQKH